MNNKFFGESYLNKYDAAYDKYKTNKNFDLKMWQEAFDRGEQDSYLTFLEHNKDTTFSNQFYDQKYYDYEGKMLEMYKPLADNTKVSMQKKQVFDAESNKWVEEDIGEMTEQQYIQYQLDKLYAEKTYEMENQILQDRREKVKWYEKVGHDVLAASGEALEGAVTGVLGVFDFIFAPFVATADAMEGANWLDAYTDYFAEGLTQIEKDTFRTELDKYERTYTHLYDDKGNQTGFGKYVGGIYNSIGRMIPAIVLNAALPGIGQAAFYTGIFSSNMNDNAINPEVAGSPSLLKVANASLKTATELVIEQALGKFLGGTIQNKLLGIVGASSTKGFKGLTKLTGWQYVLKSAAQEGLEEFCQDFSTNLIDQFDLFYREGYGNNGVTFQTLIDSFIIGALSSIVMSGGQVIIDRVVTNTKNRALEKSTGIKDAAELYTETEKVRGFNKLYFKSVISDFKSDLEKLKKTKDVGLAKQLYSTLTVMSDLYSTFSKERLTNAEKLLDRVIAADEAKPIIVDTSLSDKVKEERTRNKLTDKLMPTLPGTDTDTSLARKYEGKLAKEIIKEERTRNKLMPTLPGTDTSEAKAIATDLLVENLSKDIDDMLAVKNRELTKKIVETITKHKEKLKEANVTEVKAVVDEKGVTHKKIKLQEKKVDPVIKKLEKQEDTLAYFKKIFKTITIVDGNIVIRDEDMLFVSESWLQNYEKSEIYQFLEQEHILETLIGDDIFNTFLDDLLAFDKKFTKRKGTVTKKTALMDLLFNKSVYQAFLLTKVNKVQGGRAFAYKDFIFKLHDIINRLLKNATNKQAVSEVYNKIKASMREGTLKAILNWNIDPQTIGADSVLTDADRVEVNKYLARKNLMKQQGKISAEYLNLVPHIIANGDYSQEEKDLINKGLEPNATNKDRLMALSLLNLGDDKLNGLGYKYTPIVHSEYQERVYKLVDIISESPESRNTDAEAKELFSILKIIYNSTFIPSDDNVLNNVFLQIKSFHELASRIRWDIRVRKKILNTVSASFVDDMADGNKLKRMVTLPIEAFGDMSSDTAEIQYKADKLNEFRERYGISAKQLLLGDTKGMTLKQAELIEQEMQVLNVDNYVSFVQYKLEKMLGEDYIVIPVYENDIATDFKITKTIEIDDVLTSPLNELTKTYKTIDETIENLMFLSNNRDDIKNGSNELALATAEAVLGMKKIVNSAILSFKDLNLLEKLIEIYSYAPRNKYAEAQIWRIAEYAPVVVDILKQHKQDNLILIDCFEKSNTPKVQVLYGNEHTINYAPLQLSTVLNIDIDPEWKVILVEPNDMSISLTDKSTKTMVLTRDAYLSNSFAHELNHVIQYEYNLPIGGNISKLVAFPEYLKYVWTNFGPLIQYMVKRSVFRIDKSVNYHWGNENVNLNKLPSSIVRCLHYVAYRLLHGEILAELSAGDIKARGFILTDGRNIISPEGNIFNKRDDILPGNVNTISEYRRPTDYLIKHGNFTKEEQDLIDKGLLDNASTYDTLVSTMLLNLADRLVANDYSGIERSILKALNNIVNETDMSKLIGFLNILVELELLTDKEVSEININDRQAILELFNKVDVTQLSTNKSKQGGPRIFKLPAKYASELNKDIRLYELAENAYNKYTQLINNILNAPKVSEILYRTQFIMSLQLLYNTNFFEISNTKKNEARKIVEQINKNKNNFVNYVKTNKDSIIKLFESAKLKPLTSILGQSTVFNKEVLKRKEDAIKKFEKEYHVSIEDVIEGKVKIKGAGNQAIFVQKELEKTLGKGFSIAFDMWTQEIIVIKDFTAEQIVKDPIDTNLDLDTINRRFVKGAIKVKAGEKGLGGEIEEFNTLEIKLSDLVKEEISNEMPGWVVKLHNADKDYTALEDYSTKTIYIKTIKDMNWYDAFLHELNHAIQETYNLPVGSSPERVMNSPEYLRHVWNNYKPLVKYIFRNSNIKFDVNKKFDELPEKALDRLSDLAYMMIQGEIDAEFFAHNKQTHGFVDEGTRITDPVSGEFFPVDNTLQLPKVSAKATPDTYIENSMAREFISIYDAKKAFDLTKTRNTYHTKLSVKSSDEIIDKLIDKSVIIPPNINEIITNPEAYLSKEMLSKLKGDLSEGNVFYKLKEYVEKTFDSISIDRDRDTHQYLLVDDNAIDDFLTPTMRENAQDTKGTNLVEAYNGKTVGLSNFYSLKFDYDVKVKVGNDVNTQIDINHRNKSIVISINTNNRTNAQFIDALNHEFRHLMQEFNGLESGFSADIEVSPEMLADIKKHVPEIFKNKTLIEDAKLAGRTDTDVFIAQRFIYFLVGGEKNAYGFKADMLNTKPIYVTYEGDKFTIFMPWYDIKTGDGRYKTTYANARKDDIKYGIPQIKKKPKGKKTVTKDGKVKYLYKNNRWVTKKQAGDTNLKHFFKEGENYIQMDTDLQEFVKATTNNEGKVDKVIINAIKAGKLTKTNLFKYFRNTPTINDYTFALINEYLFKNKVINNMSELTNLTDNDGVAIYWAIAMILRRENISPEFLTAQKSLTDFFELDKYLQTTKYYKDIEKYVKKFNLYKTDKGFREFVLTSDMQKYLRVFVMKYFDGTLAGAFYMAHAFRKYVKLISLELEQREVAMDVNFDATGKGESEVTIGDTLQNKDLENTVRNTYDNDIGDDIEAFYDLENRMNEITNGDILKMQREILQTKYVAEIDELLDKTKLSADVKNVIKGWLLDTDPSSLHNMLYKAIEKQKADGKSTKLLQNILDNAILIVEKNEDWADNELAVMSVDEITKRYNLITDAQMIKTEIPKDVIANKKTEIEDRAKIAKTIKLKASQLINLIQKGEVPFKSLPTNIQNMFELKTSKTGKYYKLKSEVYSVGRGRAELPGITSQGRNLYQGKKDLSKEQLYKHDITKIIENRDNLIQTLKLAKEYAKNKDKAIKTGFKAIKTLERKLQTSTAKKIKKSETEFTIKTKHRTSDTPSNFTVISDIEMPEIVKKLFDVAFEEMAATEVQFASRDKDGNLLDKEDGKKFESRVKHEVSNWDAFYEANRAQLLALTRDDVFKIIEFISKSNAISLDGPANKIVAFEIFTLGYIVDAARRNVSSWNFSEGELTLIEKVYESKASAYGSGLNAVKQMLSIIDPFKRVRQRMLDDFNLEDEDLEPLFDAVEAVQADTNPVTRKQKEVALTDELDRLEQLMLAGDTKPRTAWQQIKSLRFTFMLSSPVTWARNVISNIIVKNFNSAADTIGNIIFNKKGYRKEQWNLSKVQISDEVKDFIDNNIKNNEMFDIIYEGKTKHDDRRKVLSAKRSLFVNMIVSSLEEKYVTQHRFNRTKWLNETSKFVSRRISDKRFIKRASERYLGKILTLENVRLDEGLSDEVLRLFAEAVIMANEDYMHKSTAVMDAIDGLKATHPVLHETLLFWQPFLNSSINWFFETYKYTPIGLINSLVRMARFETKLENVQKRRSRGEVIPTDRVTEYLLRRDVGKGFIGMALTALGIMLALSGRIRIDEEDDKFYIYAGNVKLDITQIFSSSSVLVGAAVAQVWADSRNTDYNFDDIMKLVSIQLFEGFIINDLLGRHQHNESLWESLLTEGESVLRSMVPQFVQLLVRSTNNSKIRYTAGFKGIFERWLNTFIPTQPLGTRKIDPYTGNVESKYAIPFFGEWAAILGPKFFLSQISEEERLARDYGVNKKELDAELTVNGVQIKLPSREELNKYYGELNKSTLLTLQDQKHYVKMPDGSYNTLHWNKLSDEQRANVIDRAMIRNGSIAKIYIWTQQMNKKYYASESMWQTLRQLDIVSNVYRGDKGFVE